jgi:hypothetical protein
MSETTRLTLVSRHYCHLCQEMELALSALLADFPIDLEVLDIDADPLLEASYDELVPCSCTTARSFATTSSMLPKSVII